MLSCYFHSYCNCRTSFQHVSSYSRTCPVKLELPFPSVPLLTPVYTGLHLPCSCSGTWASRVSSAALALHFLKPLRCFWCLNRGQSKLSQFLSYPQNCIVTWYKNKSQNFLKKLLILNLQHEISRWLKTEEHFFAQRKMSNDSSLCFSWPPYIVTELLSNKTIFLKWYEIQVENSIWKSK